jgi:four helix bundle protein
LKGSARRSTAEYLRFLHIALGSACELKYLADLSEELGMVGGSAWREITRQCDLVVRELERLTERLDTALSSEREQPIKARSLSVTPLPLASY